MVGVVDVGAELVGEVDGGAELVGVVDWGVFHGVHRELIAFFDVPVLVTGVDVGADES